MRVLTLILLTLLGSACFFRGEPNYEQQATEAEALISANKVLRRLDRICSELPKPDTFELAGKSAGRRILYVEYRYRTDLSYKEAKEFYDPRLTTDGWRIREERPNWGSWFQYEKDGDFVMIQRLSNAKTLSISCSDEH